MHFAPCHQHWPLRHVRVPIAIRKRGGRKGVLASRRFLVAGSRPMLTLAVLMKPFAVEWTEQRRTNSCRKSDASVSG